MVYRWRTLSYWTYRVVETLLPLSGLRVVGDPSTLIIGTPNFGVYLAAACSGLEGMGVVAVFFAAYLWVFRRDLRFPAALLLLPAGLIVVWFMNAVRIVIMTVIGEFYGEAMSDVFHSIAGWVSVLCVGLALILVSRRFRLFSRVEASGVDHEGAGLYLLPLLFILLTAVITRMAFDGVDRLYPLRVLVGLAVLFVFRAQLARFRWRPSMWSVAIGVVTFAAWTAIDFAQGGIHGDPLFEQSFARLTPVRELAWILFRTIGAVVTVPIAEELAFRGYLLRKLVDDDFRSVDFQRFTWPSVIGSSVLFGALHSQWIAGIVAGMLFALAMRKRGQLSDAVYAHAVANLLIAVFVLTTGMWSLWT
jgi:exosortase E/protease (VPEID-CTERM system)